MEWIFVVFILLVAFSFLLGRQSSGGYQYRKKGPLFTPAERSFFGVLQQAASDDMVVMGKVRIADVLSPQKGMSRKHWQTAFNKISVKHFDYVLCRTSDMEVLAVIELDDASHNKKSTMRRDAIVEAACSTADLKLLRFKAARTYQLSAVQQQINEVFLAGMMEATSK